MSRDVPDMRQQRLAEASPVQVGDVVAEKYRIDEILAVGGMGVVALAEHEVLGQRVAIKFLLQSQQNEEGTQRFLREARAAARIQSEHVVRVHDCGTLPTGVPYMVMEHLEGIELSKEMRRRGSFPPEEAVDVMLDALSGVAEAHAQGIVHRDLKPSNLFLVERPGRERVVKVLDFGISKIQPGVDAKVGDEDLTQTSMVLGSPRYISPEQARSSKTVDARADIWSLGVVLYQLLGGAPPFGGDTFGEILTNILLAKPEPLVARRDDLPPGLGDVVMRCLKRERDERYDNVAALALDLAPHGGPTGRARAERVAAILGESMTAPPTETRDPTPAVEDEGTESIADESVTRIAGAPDTVVDRGDESPTQGTWAQSHATRAPRSKRPGRLVAIGAAVALLAGAFVAYRTLAPQTGASADASSSPAEESQAVAASPTPSGDEAAGAANDDAASDGTTSDHAPSEEEPTPTASTTASASTPAASASSSASASSTPPPAPTPVGKPTTVVPRPVPKAPPPPPPSGGVLDRSD